MDERPSGWYDDPDEPSRLRYWDGQSWTERTHPKAPMPAPQPPKPPVTRLRPSRPAADDEARDGERDRGGEQVHRVAAPPVDGPRPWETDGRPAGHGGGAAGVATDPHAAPRAGYGRRLVAILIDLFIITAVWFALFVALVPVVGGDVQTAWNSYLAASEKYWDDVSRAASQSGAITLPATPEMPEALVGYTVGSGFLLAGLAVLYDFLQILFGGATLGGRLTGIRVIADATGGGAGAGRIIVRSLLKYAFLVAAGPLTLLGFVFTAVNALAPLGEPRGRALHDRWTGTRVVKRRGPRSR